MIRNAKRVIDRPTERSDPPLAYKRYLCNNYLPDCGESGACKEQCEDFLEKCQIIEDHAGLYDCSLQQGKKKNESTAPHSLADECFGDMAGMIAPTLIFSALL